MDIEKKTNAKCYLDPRPQRRQNLFHGGDEPAGKFRTIDLERETGGRRERRKEGEEGREKGNGLAGEKE